MKSQNKKINIFKKASSLIMPPVKIGGLQVTNSSLRFMQFREDKKTGDLQAESASLRLPPGIVENGRIKDRPNFIKALKTLHSQITPKANKIINAILTIPAGDVYVEVFNLPELEGKSVREAASLNMEMISPNPIEQSYYSWMVVGDPSEGSPQIEILGAFAQKEIVDEITSALEEASFAVASIEFSSLSLKRILVNKGVVQKEFPYLIIKLTQEGMIFMIIRNNNLYFNYFHPWEKVSEGGLITLEQTQSILGRESQRVLNYYSSHYGGQINKIVLITSVLHNEIKSFLESRYSGFEVALLKSDKENLHGVRGAALRGLVDRREDEEIDLLSGKMINAFIRERIKSFIALWRNILITTSVFILIVFSLSWMFVNRQAELVRSASQDSPERIEIEEFNDLKSRAQNFNTLVATLVNIKEQQNSFSSFITNVDSVAEDILISRMLMNANSGSVSINGSSNSQNSIIEFKNRLTEMPGIMNVSLPLSGIVSQADGTWTFSITFTAEF